MIPNVNYWPAEPVWTCQIVGGSISLFLEWGGSTSSSKPPLPCLLRKIVFGSLRFNRLFSGLGWCSGLRKGQSAHSTLGRSDKLSLGCQDRCHCPLYVSTSIKGLLLGQSPWPWAYSMCFLPIMVGEFLCALHCWALGTCKLCELQTLNAQWKL